MKSEATSFAILGMLSLRPMSGYDLKKAYEQGPAHFWTLNYGQIYPLLERLQRKGRVRGTRAKGPRGKREYSLTPAGRSELDRWLALQPNQPTFRNEFLLKVFFSGKSPEVVARHLQDFAREQGQILTQFDEVERWLHQRHASDSRLATWLLTLDYGRAQSQSLLAWAERGLLRFASQPSTDAPELASTSKGKFE